MGLGLIFVATSCYYDNEEYLYPAPPVRPCDTVAVSYTMHIVPIITSSCISCHSTAAAPSVGGNTVLEGYVNVQKAAVSGKLLGTVSHSPGYTPMPKGASTLSYCEITYIRRWVEGNSLNN